MKSKIVVFSITERCASVVRYTGVIFADCSYSEDLAKAGLITLYDTYHKLHV